MPDDFTPLSQVKAPAGGDDFTPTGAPAKPPEKPGIMRQAYEFLGGAPGIGATAASIAGGALAPETGGLSLLIPALAAGTTAGGIAALQGSKDPIGTGITTGLGDVFGGAIAKPLGWAGSKLASKFEMGKYVGKIGEELGQVFGMGPLKTTQDIYNAIHTGEAGNAISGAYKQAQKQIFSVVSPDTPIKGPPARYLNQLYYEHVPEYRQLIDAIVSNAQAKRGAGYISKYSSFKKGAKQEGSDLLNQALGDVPLTVENAMEYARLLGASSATAKKGAAGFAVRDANREARDTIAKALDLAAPGQNLGAAYTKMNSDFRKGMTALSAFGERELFKETPKGPVFNRVEWQRASNDAIKKLREVGLEEIDKAVRLGRQPGAAGTVIGAHGRIGSPGIKWFHPGTWMQFNMENPLRPESEQISKDLLRKIFQAGGANIGAQIGE